MKRLTLRLSIAALALLLCSNVGFSQATEPANLGILTTFEAFTGSGGISNTSGTVTGDAGTHMGTITGSTYGGDEYIADETTDQARYDLLRLYIHLNDLFVDYPSTHAPAFGGEETLTPGVYSVAGAGSLGTGITLDGGGDPNPFFIIKFGGAFTVGASAKVTLTGGTKSSNVFFLANGAISVAANADIKGTLFSKGGAVGLGTDAVLEGRMLTMAGAITLGTGASASPPLDNITIPVFCEAGCAPAPAVDVLGSVSEFALFSSFGAVANTGISGINGRIGSNSGAVSGYAGGTHIGTEHSADEITAQAATDLDAAYEALMLLPVTGTHAAAFGNETVAPGVYDMAAGSIGGTVTLDASGVADPANAIFVFRFAGAFNAGAGSTIILAGGAKRCNVFWIGGAGVTTGAVNMGAGSILKGTFISHGGACNSGAGVFLAGRQLSTGGAVNTNAGVLYTNPECVTSTSLSGETIAAVADTLTVNSPGTTTSLISNDLLGGNPVVIGTDSGEVTMSITGPLPAGITINTTTGTVTVANGTAAGNLSITYKICEVSNPTNCASVTSTIVVTDTVVAVMEAVADTPTINGSVGGTTSLTSNDLLGGNAVVIGTDSGEVTMSIIAPVPLPAGITVDTTTGTLTVAPHMPAGSYDITYQLCEASNPTNCASVTSTIEVKASAADSSNADPGIAVLMTPATMMQGSTGTLSAIVGNYGQDTIVPNSLRFTVNVGSNAEITGTNGSLQRWSIESQTPGLGNTMVFTNTVGGFGGFDVDDISIEVTGSVSGLELIHGFLEYTGGASNSLQGNATIENDTSQTSLTVFGMVAQNDIAGPVNGLLGQEVVANIFANDTLNGSPVLPGDVTLFGITPSPFLVLDTLGAVILGANTPAGTYTLTYEICEIANPANCDTANVIVEVFRETPDFTPTIDVGSLNITSTGSKNVIININGVKPEASYGSIVVKISKGTAFYFSYDSTATGLSLDGSTPPAPHTPVDNVAWELTDENPFFITMTLKSGDLIAGNSFSNFGFGINVKPGVPIQTMQPITVTIVNGTGLDGQNNNNAYSTVVVSIDPPL